MDEDALDNIEEDEDPLQSATFEVATRDPLECLSGDAYDCFVRKIVGRLDLNSIAALGCASKYWKNTIGDPQMMFDTQAYAEECLNDAKIEAIAAKARRVAMRWEGVCIKVMEMHKDKIKKWALRICDRHLVAKRKREKHEREMHAYSVFWNRILKPQ